MGDFLPLVDADCGSICGAEVCAFNTNASEGMTSAVSVNGSQGEEGERWGSMGERGGVMGNAAVAGTERWFEDLLDDEVFDEDEDEEEGEEGERDREGEGEGEGEGDDVGAMSNIVKSERLAGDQMTPLEREMRQTTLPFTLKNVFPPPFIALGDTGKEDRR